MKLFVILVLTVIIAVSNAGNIGGFYYDSRHPGKCLYKGLVLSPGQQGQPKGECMLFACKGEDGFALIHGCDKQVVKPSCRLGDFINRNAPYPECCKKHIICD